MPSPIALYQSALCVAAAATRRPVRGTGWLLTSGSCISNSYPSTCSWLAGNGSQDCRRVCPLQPPGVSETKLFRKCVGPPSWGASLFGRKVCRRISTDVGGYVAKSQAVKHASMYGLKHLLADRVFRHVYPLVQTIPAAYGIIEPVVAHRIDHVALYPTGAAVRDGSGK